MCVMASLHIFDSMLCESGGIHLILVFLALASRLPREPRLLKLPFCPWNQQRRHDLACEEMIPYSLA